MIPTKAIFHRWAPFILLPLFVGLVYLNPTVLNSPFVFDDTRMIMDNPLLRTLGSPVTFFKTAGSRCLVDFTFAVNFKMSGLDVTPFHMTNILIHLANCFLCYYFLLLFLKGPMLKTSTEQAHFTALFTALVFGMHPIQTQTVIYISQRYTSMSAFFYLAALICYLKARLSQVSRGRKAFQIICFSGVFISGALAFLSKQNAASLPLMLFVVEFFCMDSSLSHWKKCLPWIVGLALLIVLFFFYAAGLFRPDSSFLDIVKRLDAMTREISVISRWDYLCTQFSVVLIYIRLFFWPSGLHLDWHYPISKSFFDGYTPHAFALLLLILVAAVKIRKRSPVVSFGIFWFFTALLVESSVIPIRDALVEHRLYLPMAGLILPIGFYLSTGLKIRPKVVCICALAVIGITGATSWNRTAVWKNQLSLWEDSASKSDNNAKAVYNLGIYYEKAGMDEKAYGMFVKAIKINSGYAAPYAGIGKYLASRGKLKESEFYLKKSIALDPSNGAACLNLSLVYIRLNRGKESIRYLNQAARYNKSDPILGNRVGTLLMKFKQYEDAYHHFRYFLNRNVRVPPELYIMAGACALRTGRKKEVVPLVKKGVEKGFNNWDRIKSDGPLMEALAGERIPQLYQDG